MDKKKIVIGCDNAAVGLKKEIEKLLDMLGYEYEDIGVAMAEDQTAYPIVAQRLCQVIIDSEYEKLGILVCGTGIGMAMTANKFPGIFAAVCHDNYSAERAKLSNNANVLCMGARIVGVELAKKITKEWLSLEFVDGRSTSKVEAMCAIDAATRK